jgi:hypothetical protein
MLHADIISDTYCHRTVSSILKGLINMNITDTVMSVGQQLFVQTLLICGA